MSTKLYRCIDCGKEFKFDYSEINPNLNLSDYKKNLNFPEEINICLQCLKNINIPKDNLSPTNSNQLIEKLTQKNIEHINQRYSKEELDLKNYDENEEKKMEEELNKIKTEVEKDESDLNNLLKDLEKMENDENNFCNEFCNLETKLYLELINKKNYSGLINNLNKKIYRINTTNIFSELFKISFSEKFGSINGCKFCDPYISNNYDSINGGWGYIILLTKLLSIKYLFESNKYDLIPEGNFSRIKIKNGGEEIEIGISDMNRTMEKFNKAMEIYLEYLNEFLDFLKKEGKIEIKNEENICPKITGNKIKDKCIHIEEGKDKNLDNWFQCMKYLLHILKFLICQTLNNENNFYK